MSNKHDPLVRVAKSLGYSDGDVGKILAALDGDSLHAAAIRAAADRAAPRVPAALSINAAAAAHPENADKLRRIQAWARTLGVTIDPSRALSVAQLDQQLAGKPTDERWRFKNALAGLGLVAVAG